MTIFLNILFLILGMALLIKGADFFVSGASAVAKKMKISPLIIGLTIVAIGTSLPELAVSVTSAINHYVDLSVANVVGSNIFNMFFILGAIAIFSPVNLQSTTKTSNFVFLGVLTTLLLLFSCDVFLNGDAWNILSRTEALVIFALFICYLMVLIYHAKIDNKEEEKLKAQQQLQAEVIEKEKVEEKKEKDLKVWQIILYIVFGLAAVVFGGECVSSTAKFLALKMGMSEALVGLTIVSIGTSLPELATSVIAAKKHENDLALGNLIGSNISNIGLILGTVGLINPIGISTTVLTDIGILLGFTIILTAICAPKKQIGKGVGFTLLGLYFAYLTFAIVRNYCF